VRLASSARSFPRAARGCSPLSPRGLRVVAVWDQRRKRRRSRQDCRLNRTRKHLLQAWQPLTEKVDGILLAASADKLAGAVEADVLTLYPPLAVSQVSWRIPYS
jgi:hypothetical protein